MLASYMYPSDFVVLQVILQNDGKQMTYNEIVAKAQNIVSYPTVVRAIDRLEADNHIRVNRNQGSPRGNEYHVVIK